MSDNVDAYTLEKLAEIERLKAQLREAKRYGESMREEVLLLQGRASCQEPGWHVIGDDGEWNRFATEWEAEAYAENCATEGTASTVVRVTVQKVASRIEDMDAHNGIIPGVDCPRTLNPSRAA